MPTELLTRRNVVREALRAYRRPLHQLLIDREQEQAPLQEILQLAEQARVPIQRLSRSEFRAKTSNPQASGGEVTQGVALRASSYPYVDLQDLTAVATARNEAPFLLLLDLIQSPGNIGRMLRTAEAVGIHGVVLQERRGGEITPEVVEASQGASEHLAIARVANLVQTMRKLKEQNIWLAGLDLGAGAQPLHKTNLKGALGIVVGNEGEGLRRLVRETCDFLVFLPMRGQIDSLNAAIAASVLMYQAWQARGYADTATSTSDNK
jgi:23S rRNA (guanosine2251-2'-O)-methyltransferase